MDTSRNRIYTCFHLNYSCLCKRKVEHIPYGWDELDIVGVVAQLINDQKVIIKVSGEVIPANDHRMIGFLRNKSYIGQTNISRREKVNQLKFNNARTFLREYLDVMTVPTDEDGLPNRCLDPEINSNLSIVLLEEPFVEWLGYNPFEEPVVEKKRKWFGK